MFTLSDHQEDVLEELLELPGKVVALRGLAGTGKTSVIPALARAVGGATIAAPTNRAAGVLRRKGMSEAMTIYKACLRPYYTEQFNQFEQWVRNPNSLRMPVLLKKFTPEEAIRKVSECSNDPGLACVAFNINPMDHVLGWAAREQDQQTCLIVDEASMVGDRVLEEAKQVFDRIILVGDPGQLSPIKDNSSLNEAPGVELTDIHRQAKDSPIVQFAHAIRNARYGEILDPPPGIETATGFDPAKGPVIVYTNRTRRSLNAGMRHRLGYPEHELRKGEPLVCKATTKEWTKEGLINNSLWTYLGNGTVADEDGVPVYVGEDMHVESIDKDPPHFRDCQFQLGYAITAHTAQGSEWPSVQIYVNEVDAFSKNNSREETQKWLYTAVTRAKENLILVYA